MKPVFHAKGIGETTGLARWFFKVEDYYESYFDDHKPEVYGGIGEREASEMLKAFFANRR